MKTEAILQIAKERGIEVIDLKLDLTSDNMSPIPMSIKKKIVISEIEYELINGIYHCCHTLTNLDYFKAKFYYQCRDQKDIAHYIDHVNVEDYYYSIIKKLLKDQDDVNTVFDFNDLSFYNFSKIEVFDLEDYKQFEYINNSYENKENNINYIKFCNSNTVLYFTQDELVAESKEEYIKYKKLNNIS